MTEMIIYLSALLIGFTIVFQVLRAINFESIFKRGKIFEIKLGYFIFSLIGGHIIAEIIVKITNLIIN